MNRLLTLLICCSLLTLACTKNPIPQYKVDPYYCVDDDPEEPEEPDDPDPDPQPDPGGDPDPGPGGDPDPGPGGDPDPGPGGDPDPDPQPVDPEAGLDNFGHNDIVNQ